MIHDMTSAYKQDPLTEIVQGLKANCLRFPDMIGFHQPGTPILSHLFIITASESAELFDAIPVTKDWNDLKEGCNLVPFGSNIIPCDITARMITTPWKALEGYSAGVFAVQGPDGQEDMPIKGRLMQVPTPGVAFIVVSDKIFNSLKYILEIFPTTYKDKRYDIHGMLRHPKDQFDAVHIASVLSWMVAAEKADKVLTAARLLTIADAAEKALNENSIASHSNTSSEGAG